MVVYRLARDNLSSFRYEEGFVGQEMSGRQDVSAESKGTKMFVWRPSMRLGVCRSFTQAMLSGTRYLCSTFKGATPV